MAENISELTTANFDKKVSKGMWVIDFWAEWCGPCRMMAPHFEAAAKDLKGKVNFGKVDIEKNEELAERFQVMSIPTMIVLKDGEQINRTAGAMPKDQIIHFAQDSE